MTDDDVNKIYTWHCAAGHEVAISELMLRLGMVEPVCPIVVAPTKICGAQLTHRVALFWEVSDGRP